MILMMFGILSMCSGIVRTNVWLFIGITTQKKKHKKDPKIIENGKNQQKYT